MNVSEPRFRIAIIADRPLLCEGLPAMLSEAAEVVECVASVQQVGQALEAIDAVVVDLEANEHEIDDIGVMSPGIRIVGLHSGRTGAEIRGLATRGVEPLVDTSSAPEVLLGAVAGSEARTLLRWSRPAIRPLPLSPREQTVLELVADGNTAAEIAELLRISVRTVQRHRQRILERFGVQSQAQAVAIAMRSGLLDKSARARQQRS